MLKESEYGFPLSRVSRRARYSRSRSIRSASLLRRFPRLEASIVRQGLPSLKASLAAETALSTSALSPSATSQILSPVAGLMVAKVFPLTESTHSLLMKSFVNLTSGEGSERRGRFSAGSILARAVELLDVRMRMWSPRAAETSMTYSNLIICARRQRGEPPINYTSPKNGVRG